MNLSNLNYSYLIYLILILIFLLGTFFLSNKKNINRNMQNLSIWGLIFFAALASYYIWSDIKVYMSKEKFNYLVENDDGIIIKKAYDGHFYLPLYINNIETVFLVDTGATKSLLSKNDLVKVRNKQVFLPSEKILETANGKIIAKEIVFQNVRLFERNLGEISFLVVKKDFEGPKISLLGLDLLNKKFKYEITNNYIKIQIPTSNL